LVIPKIKYIDKTFYKKNQALILEINRIIADYESQGYGLTLRQIYYVLVTKNIIANEAASYDNLVNLVRDARLAGLIDWLSVEDRTRSLRGFSYFNSPMQFLQEVIKHYRIDPWKNQEYYVECWVEKDALIDIIAQASSKYDVNHFSCRGFTSVSEMWKAAQRFIYESNNGKQCVVIHLGDFDPSGLEMSHDIQNRFNIFGANVSVERIALNMPQIEQYKPPPNPAKTTDTRSKNYIAQYGTASWELDALNPKTLDTLITDKILQYLDLTAYDKIKTKQESEVNNMLQLLEI
jgi:hypothetical protein